MSPDGRGGSSALCGTHPEPLVSPGFCSLLPSLATLGAACVMDVLAGGWPPLAAAEAGLAQDPALATRAPKLRPEMGCLDGWDGPAPPSSDAVLRRWRAFDGSIGVHAYFAPRAGQPARRVKLLKLRPAHAAAHPPPASPGAVPGSLVFDGAGRGALWLRTADGWVELEQLQMELKPRPATGADFARGYGISLASGHRFAPAPAG